MARSNLKAVKVGPQGRIVIPAELRRELGINTGDELVPSAEDGRLILTSREAAFEHLREIFSDAPPERILSEEVLRERREDARRDETKWKRRAP
jgi:AbrB family looped-hinge helix DNA binding protein